MESLQSISPMVWMIFASAAIISIAVLLNKAIKFMVKVAVLIVMALFIIYFLVQAGLLLPPGAQ